MKNIQEQIDQGHIKSAKIINEMEKKTYLDEDRLALFELSF